MGHLALLSLAVVLSTSNPAAKAAKPAPAPSIAQIEKMLDPFRCDALQTSEAAVRFVAERETLLPQVAAQTRRDQARLLANPRLRTLSKPRQNEIRMEVAEIFAEVHSAQGGMIEAWREHVSQPAASGKIMPATAALICRGFAETELALFRGQQAYVAGFRNRVDTAKADDQLKSMADDMVKAPEKDAEALRYFLPPAPPPAPADSDPPPRHDPLF